jgi:2-polyprenyl-3-methyl-5-hydroxy-6-metoxy-1,4-benzoquinol methylase
LKAFENKFFNETRTARVRIFADRLTEIQKHVKGNQLLDIGSAVGIFLDANRLAGKPFEITSCDLSEEACAYIDAHYEEVHVVHSDVMLLPEEKLYDCITLWDTLEHIVDPASLLKKIGKLLRHNGVLCFSTPNTASFEWQVMGPNHVQLLPPGHVNLYNTHNIRILMQSAGFAITSLRTPNASLDVSYIKKVLTQLECEKSLGALDGKVGALMKILVHAFWVSDVVEEALIGFLKQQNMAGNMVVVATKAQLG